MDQITEHVTCSICTNQFMKPVSLLCGHTFCKTCLYSTQSKNSKKCPLCKGFFTGNPQTMKVNQVIELVRLTIAPYSEEEDNNQKSIIAELDTQASRLPAFLQGEYFCPGSTTSFNFFEPRYKLLVELAQVNGGEFLYCCVEGTLSGSQAIIGNMEEVRLTPHNTQAVKVNFKTKVQKIKDQHTDDSQQGLNFCGLEEVHDEPFEADDEQLKKVDMINSFLAIFSKMIGQTVKNDINLDSQHLCTFNEVLRTQSNVFQTPEEVKVFMLSGIKYRVEKFWQFISQFNKTEIQSTIVSKVSEKSSNFQNDDENNNDNPDQEF